MIFIRKQYFTAQFREVCCSLTLITMFIAGSSIGTYTVQQQVMIIEYQQGLWNFKIVYEKDFIFHDDFESYKRIKIQKIKVHIRVYKVVSQGLFLLHMKVTEV
jgi:hypothetical protein